MTKKENKEVDKKPPMFFLAKYSGLAFQMLGIIIVGVFAGKKIDEKTSSDFPLWTLILSLLSIIIALYVVLKDLINPNEPKH